MIHFIKILVFILPDRGRITSADDYHGRNEPTYISTLSSNGETATLPYWHKLLDSSSTRHSMLNLIFKADILTIFNFLVKGVHNYSWSFNTRPNHCIHFDCGFLMLKLSTRAYHSRRYQLLRRPFKIFKFVRINHWNFCSESSNVYLRSWWLIWL